MDDSLTHSDLSFLEVLKDYSLESKMLACQKYACRIMNCSEVSMQRALIENIMPWELETFVMFSVLYDDESSNELTMNVFESVITKIRNYWHPELTISKRNGTYSYIFFMISAIQQFPTQGLITQKLFRYSHIFKFRNDKIDFSIIFKKNFSAEYDAFDEAAFIVFLACCGDNKSDGLTKSHILQEGLSDSNVISALLISKSDFVKKIYELYKGEVTDYYYGLKVSYWWPVIEDNSYCYIPLPYLIINAVTESFLQRITIRDRKLRSDFGKEIMEKYLYDIYSEVSTVTWISREISYKIGKDDKRTSDVLVGEDKYCIYFDTKALTPSLKVRKFERDEIETNIKLYSNALKEIYVQIKNYEHGYYPLDRKYEIENIFGVVVVWDDSYISRKVVYDKIYDSQDLSNEEKRFIHSHIKIVSLRQVEKMVLQNTSFLASLKVQVDNPTMWNDINYVNATKENGLIVSYNNYVEDLKARVRKRVEKL